MAITAYFYQFDKKVNSTKIPTTMQPGDIGLAVELKDVTNLYTPSLVISANVFTDGQGNITNPMKYSYCYLPDFERYYFVRSWSWIVGRWECALEVDVMASFKTQIGNTYAYVLRSASSYDPDVVDNKYPCKRSMTINRSTLTPNTSPWNINILSAGISDGFYVVSIANHDNNAVGAVAHYAFSAAALEELMSIMYNAPNWMNITDTQISTDLQKMMLNPIQYITSVMWIPTGFNTTGLTSISAIPYGWWTITLQNTVAYRLNGSNFTKSLSFDFDVVNHPQYDASKRKWLKLPPYTTAALRFEPFGMFSIDVSKLADYSKIRCIVWVDFITGTANLSVYQCYYDSGYWVQGGLIYTTTTQLGVPIAIAQMSIDMARLSNTSTWVGGAALAVTSDNSLQESVSASVQAVGEAVSGGLIGRLQRFWKYLTDRDYRQNYSPEVEARSENAVQNAATSILNTVKEVAPAIGNAALAASAVCESKGTSGSFAMLSYPPSFTFYFQNIVDTDDVHYGIPLCRIVKINTLSGFVQCANSGDLSPNCTPVEKQAIVAIMEAGFYYE